jgi:hypothetical protein
VPAPAHFIARLPDVPAGHELSDLLLAAAQSRGFGDDDLRLFPVSFVLPPGDAYLDHALDLPDPVEICGPVDILHSFTRFTVRASAASIVATVHDIAPLSDPPSKLETLAMTRRAVLIAVSAATRRDLNRQSRFQRQVVHVIPPEVSERFYEETTEPAEWVSDGRDAVAFELLTVGGAGENKNLERLVESVSMLRRFLSVHLTMVGAREWGYEQMSLRLAVNAGGCGSSIGASSMRPSGMPRSAPCRSR